MVDQSPLPEAPRAQDKQRRDSWGRQVKKALTRALLALNWAVVPRLYMAWMWLVFRTSRVEDVGLDIEQLRPAYGGAVGALWHDEVVTVAYAFRKYHGHTLASHGDFGELITRMLQMCNFTVFRGGSSSGRSRRSTQVLNDMIEHMNANENVIYGITVDGSKGPPYRMKKGACIVASQCAKPLFIERTWFRSYARLANWDRTLVPMPFNRIVHAFAGPYLPPPPDSPDEDIEAFRRHVENELLELTFHVRGLLEESPRPDRLQNYPEGWQPSWGDSPELVRDFAPLPSRSPQKGQTG